MTAALLEVADLRTHFETDLGEAQAVDGVSFRVNEGETVALVGESGCGKSVTALSLLGLVPQPPGQVLEGSSVRLRGEELTSAGEARLRQVRGGEISMIFQEPMTSLNPVFTVGDQVKEAILAHQGEESGDRRGRSAAAMREAIDWLARVGITDPERRYRYYPHQLSGGMRQRVMIAMALSTRPALLIADEPTTALDVTVQGQILDLLSSLQDELGTAVLLITHDLGVVAQVADRVLVMYGGRIVEAAPVEELYDSPAHPYSEGLLQAVPDPKVRRDRLAEIPGSVPHAAAWPDGCRFRPRCPYAWQRCLEEPDLAVAARGSSEHRARCWLAVEPQRRTGPGFEPTGGRTGKRSASAGEEP
jgi:oligopeptide/dipeptide ABC transporter ATP-binding protein